MPVLCKRPAADPPQIEPSVPPMPPISMTTSTDKGEAEAA